MMKSSVTDTNQAVRRAWNRGHTDRQLVSGGNHFFNAHKVASDLYPADDRLFEAYMQGWDAGASPVNQSTESRK